jgi:hypothetical protein
MRLERAAHILGVACPFPYRIPHAPVTAGSRGRRILERAPSLMRAAPHRAGRRLAAPLRDEWGSEMMGAAAVGRDWESGGPYGSGGTGKEPPWEGGEAQSGWGEAAVEGKIRTWDCVRDAGVDGWSMVVAKWAWRISSGGADPEKLEMCGSAAMPSTRWWHQPVYGVDPVAAEGGRGGR